MGGPEKKTDIVVLCGPTASGKTGMACALADRFDLEIVSADSRQVYRKMDVGTAKPSGDELAEVKHHLIDVVDPDQDFSVADYVERAHVAIRDITSRGCLPLVVGGTGLYLRALTDGLAPVPPADDELRQKFRQYERKHGEGSLHRWLRSVDPIQAERIHPNNLVRIVRALEVYELSGTPLSKYQQQHGFEEEPYRALKLYLNLSRDDLNTRIEERVDRMIEDGLVEEVRNLLEAGYDPDIRSMKAIGYREVIACLSGEIELEEAIELIKRETRRYAKRQETWFKKEKAIISVDSSSEIDRIQQLIECFLLQKGSGYGQDTI